MCNTFLDHYRHHKVSPISKSCPCPSLSACCHIRFEDFKPKIPAYHMRMIHWKYHQIWVHRLLRMRLGVWSAPAYYTTLIVPKPALPFALLV